MKSRFVIFALVFTMLLSTASASFSANNVEPRKPECPASGSGRHEYSALEDKTIYYHESISETRCITYYTTYYRCSACGNSFYSAPAHITEHIKGSAECQRTFPPLSD